MNMPGFTAEASLSKSVRIYSQRYLYSGLAFSQSVSPMGLRTSPSSALGYSWFKGGTAPQGVGDVDVVLISPNAGACYCASCVFGSQCTTYVSPSCDPAFLDWWCGSWIAVKCPGGYHPCMNYDQQELKCCENAPAGPDFVSAGVA